MVSWLVESAVLPIGICLDSDLLRMAQLRYDGRDTELLAVASASIPRAEGDGSRLRLQEAARKIRELHKAGRFKGRQCVLSLPPEATFIHHMKVPRLRAEQVAQVLRMELKRKMPSSADDMVIRHVVAGEVSVDGKTQQEVIVIAAPHEALKSRLSMAEEAGLDVVGVSSEACAVVECWSHLMRREDDASRAVLFVHIGNNHTQVVLTHGSSLVFARTLPVGGECFDKMIADGLGVSLQKANEARMELGQGRGDAAMAAEIYRLLEAKLDQTAGELTQCLRYYESVFRDRRAELVVFVGTQAFDKNVCQALAKRLNLPAKIGDPLVSIAYSDWVKSSATIDQRVPHPDWTLPIGLSLGSVWGR